jgi:pimeloyl-ACP methyl ester carboxylesterase
MPEVIRAGVRLFYSDLGVGPPIFWHTGGGGDGSMWQTAGYLDRLPDRRHLLFDHRGHGRSDKPLDPQAHRVDEYLADVLAVLDDAQVERAALVGYSDGAYLLFNLAARHPERVSALIAMGGVAAPGDTLDYRLRMADAVRSRGLAALMRDLSAGESEPAPEWLLRILCETTDEMFIRELEGWAGGPVEPELFPQIQAPTLIVCGESENSDGAAELAVARLPRGETRVLPGYGHLQVFWHAELVAPLIGEFLGRQAETPAAR